MLNWFKSLQKWTKRLPAWLGFRQAELHTSLFISLVLLSVFFVALSGLRPGFGELLTLAVTIPVVWSLSLAIRFMAQQLALGEYANDTAPVIGPAGNLQTDYEYLPPRVVFAYAMTGQLASLGLVSIGLIVGAAMIPQVDGNLTLAQLFDLKGGFACHAWATQVMWVNIFLFGIHCLPTVPFDMRAGVFAYLGNTSPGPNEPYIFRRIASVDSHLAALALGGGIATAAAGIAFQHEDIGWYAAIAVAVYLFVASQWESTRAEELEEQLAKTTTLSRLDVGASVPASHLRLSEQDGIRDSDPIEGYTAEAFDSADLILDGVGDVDDPNEEHDAIDVDEILRKVHKEGTEALTEFEREALLSASQAIKQKRSDNSH